MRSRILNVGPKITKNKIQMRCRCMADLEIEII